MTTPHNNSPEGFTVGPINRECIHSKVQPKQSSLLCGLANRSSDTLLGYENIFHFYYLELQHNGNLELQAATFNFP